MVTRRKKVPYSKNDSALLLYYNTGRLRHSAFLTERHASTAMRTSLDSRTIIQRGHRQDGDEASSARGAPSPHRAGLRGHRRARGVLENSDLPASRVYHPEGLETWESLHRWRWKKSRRGPRLPSVTAA